MRRTPTGIRGLSPRARASVDAELSVTIEKAAQNSENRKSSIARARSGERGIARTPSRSGSLFPRAFPSLLVDFFRQVDLDEGLVGDVFFVGQHFQLVQHLAGKA